MTLSDPALLRGAAFIDGAFVSDSPLGREDVLDPGNGETLATVPRVSDEMIAGAIAGAERAQAEWRKQPFPARAAIVGRMARLMEEHEADLAKIITLEEGKPLAEAAGEVRYAHSFFTWFAEEGRRAYGETIPSATPNQRILVQPEPIGVTCAITPWNFPSAMITRKLGPALVGGNAMLLKPAEATPLSALAVAEIAQRAGLPAGLFQVLTGGREDAARIGSALTESEVIRKLSFTGSTAVGKILYAQCASTVKRVSLELGGNAPFIVFDDADLDVAVPACMAIKFRNSGQACVSVQRIYVQRGIADAFIERLGEAMEALVVGHGLEDGVRIGPMINMAGADKVARHIDDARERGASIVLGGDRHTRGGSFYAPSLVVDVPEDALMVREESFGPIAGVQRFDEEADVIRRANDTRMGPRRVRLHPEPAPRARGLGGASVRHDRRQRRRPRQRGRPVWGHERERHRQGRQPARPRGSGSSESSP